MHSNIFSFLQLLHDIFYYLDVLLIPREESSALKKHGLVFPLAKKPLP